MPKTGSHFDLAIALALLAALEVVPRDAVGEAIAIGELSLDGRLNPVIAAPNLLRMIHHLSGLRPIEPAQPGEMTPLHSGPDLREV